MASMDDLIATMSGGLHAGSQGNDLKDLHAKLAQTLHPTKAPFRPIPPPTALSPNTSTGPLPPPAPASSWNDSYPSSAANASNAWGGMGNSPRQGAAYFPTQRETGFSIPPPKNGGNGSSGQSQGQGNGQGREGQGEIPYHASVLPVKASPKDTPGFGDDAFKPLWDEKAQQKQQGGFGRNQ